MLSNRNINNIIIEEKGFALPSVLFLVTILSLVILSIVTIKYLHRQSALLAVAQVKADYAALNGINQAIVEINITESPPLGNELTRQYDYGSQGSASIRIGRWGLFYYIVSQGQLRRTVSERVALLASQPTRQFENALVFANNQHQLILITVICLMRINLANWLDLE